MRRKNSDRVRSLAENLAIILVAPKYGENIGAAARIAGNMGITRLIVVAPALPDPEKMEKMATRHAARLLDEMEVYSTLGEAVSSFSWVVGTSARQGRRRPLFSPPREVARDLVPLLKHNRVAFLFGPEDRGLTNEDLKYCNQISAIPTADFSSLNLAQAVAVFSYEMYTAILEAAEKKPGCFVPKRVEAQELAATYSQVEMVLRRSGSLKDTDLDYWMNNIRLFLGRIGLRAREAKVIRSFCRQLVKGDNRQRGEKTAEP